MRPTPVVLAAVVLTVVFAGASGSSSGSGLRGVVMREPTEPVCRTNSCEAPVRGLVLRFFRDGVVKAEAKTSRAGTYSVELRPGRYAVRAAPRRPGIGLTPRVVRVPRGSIGRVDFHLDTGIQ